MNEFFIAYFLPIAGTSLATFLVRAVDQLFKKIEQKYSIDIDDALEARFLSLVETSVQSVEQSYVKGLKKKGKFTTKQHSVALNQALKLIEQEIVDTALDTKLIIEKDTVAAVESAIAKNGGSK